MPVPKRRKSSGSSALLAAPAAALKLLDIDYIFQRSRTLLFYTFAPSVILMGMLREPAPTSWFELINIW
eukprot:CAMPEP_0198109636 /NCGR_PEP_ID=MMETSP1442-20131203/1693_1 /TAXON_ID= /ORGANISM="Craspedostauros australis, Strain CCMP3328" /LENGTH=68 /DNA_ID=CAMNT_0043765385 /DNA_START=131 /DNA_END=334 /DNA_ORIENTATION=+